MQPQPYLFISLLTTTGNWQLGHKFSIIKLIAAIHAVGHDGKILRHTYIEFAQPVLPVPSVMAKTYGNTGCV